MTRNISPNLDVRTLLDGDGEWVPFQDGYAIGYACEYPKSDTTELILVHADVLDLAFSEIADLQLTDIKYFAGDECDQQLCEYSDRPFWD
jgi:hypothetical protein